MIDNTIIKHRLLYLLHPQTDIITVDYADFERVAQGNDNCVLIELENNATSITTRLQAEIAKDNPDKASKAVLRIGYSADVEVQFEEVQHILRVINDALPNANLVWGYGIDDKLPDGHCSILLLIG